MSETAGPSPIGRPEDAAPTAGVDATTDAVEVAAPQESAASVASQQVSADAAPTEEPTTQAPAQQDVAEVPPSQHVTGVPAQQDDSTAPLEQEAAAVAQDATDVAQAPQDHTAATEAPRADTVIPEAPRADTVITEQYGRVEADGTVYVITAQGERRVGQVPDVDPADALAFYVRRYQTLDTEVGLLEARVKSGALGADEARKSIDAHRKAITDANAVGDLATLSARLDALAPALAAQAEQKKAEKARNAERARSEKERMVAEAEKLAQGNDWRGGVNRFRSLLDEWKALPRIDRATDDALWHRFSSARTTYTRRRKAQFAEQNAKRAGAKQLKEEIIAEAEQLVGSTEWGPTAGAFRDLMARWKAAGAAPRAEDDKLWARFRGIQDEFFAARDSAMAEQDKEFIGNQQAKEALLDEAEKTILPVSDLATARTQFRDFLAKFNEHGKVPRDAIRPLDARVRKLESAVKDAEAEEWRRTDPEARQRAADTVAMFSGQIQKLTAEATKLDAAGKDKKAAEVRDSIATYQSWLDQAQKALDEFKA